MADERSFQVKIINPERVFYDGEAIMLEFNTTEGQIGIYKNHVPTTVILKPGILKITEAEQEKKAALHSGFVEILKDKVTILAETVEWPGEIDESRAEAAKERAVERLRSKTPETDLARAETALQRAVARIQVHKI